MKEIDLDDLRQTLNLAKTFDVSMGSLLLVEEPESFLEDNSGPLKLDFFAMVICSEGSLKGKLNGKMTTLQSSQILIIMPGMVASDYNVEKGTALRMIAVSSATLVRSVFIDSKVWKQYSYLTQHPVIPVIGQGMEIIDNFYNLGLSLQHKDPLPYDKIVNQNLMVNSVYETLNLCDFLMNQEGEDNSASQTQGSKLFIQFMEKATTGSGRSRSVTAIADELCVTPKHLSKVVKDASGATPLQWLHEITIKQVMNDLRYSDKTIKEISNGLGFPNVSSFGTFVRKSLGVSPRQYRERYI